jgi:uncharacterized protein (UPF0548 family)
VSGGSSRLAALAAAVPTYPEVGATRGALLGDDPFGRTRPGDPANGGALPAGYRHLRHRRRVGSGTGDFHVAAGMLHSWRMHRAAGLDVEASGPAVEGTVVLARLAGLAAPCRVVWSVPVVESDSGGVAGFGYGTLAGHPVRGEEGFVITLAADGGVWFDLAAFSVPGRWFTKLGAPVTRLAQSWFAKRCGEALARAVSSRR